MTRWAGVATAVAMVLVAGCRSRAKCEARVGELMTFLNAMDHRRPLAFVDDSVQLVDRPELPPHESMPIPVVQVTHGKRLLDSKPVTPDQLAAGLAAAKAKPPVMPMRELANFDDRQVALVVDRDAPWRDVAVRRRDRRDHGRRQGDAAREQDDGPDR